LVAAKGARSVIAADRRSLPLPGRRNEATASPEERFVVVALAATVALAPFLGPRGPLNSSPVDVSIAVALGAFLLWTGTPGRRLRAPYAVSVGLLITGGALGALVGPVPTVGLISLVQDIVLLLWCTAIVNVARTPGAMGILLRTWVAASIIWAGILLVGVLTSTAALTGVTTKNGGRISLTLGDPNFAANYFVVSIMIVWAVQWPRHRALRIPIYAALLWCWALAGSNSGLVSLVVALAVAGLVGVWRRWGAVPAIAGACLAATGALLIAPNVSTSDLQRAAEASQYRFIRDWIGRSSESTDAREKLLHEGIHLYYHGSLLGEGPASTKPRLIATQASYVKEAHNDYLASITERGVVGALGLIMLVGSLLVRTWTMVAAPLAVPYREVVPRPNAIAGAVAAVLTVSTVYELLHVRHAWALLGIVAALSLWGRHE
jgi:O-antigen ligase